jgi:hypothetical protein
MMSDPSKTNLERAFDLARSGTCSSIERIRQRLKAEGYDHNMVVGRSLKAQLRALIAAANNAAH